MIFPSQIFTNIGFSIVQRAKEINPNIANGGLEGLTEDNSGTMLPGVTIDTTPNILQNEPAAHSFFFDVADVTAINKTIRLSAELNWQTDTWNHHGDDDELYFTPGIVALLSDDLSFGIGTPIGLNKGADDYRIIGMLMYQFNLFNK